MFRKIMVATVLAAAAIGANAEEFALSLTPKSLGP